ncbi:MAG TPA: hypothetical protein VE954_00410 [Oligoflexus sp.]|uniref:hypothetical protein n=1 Tax=Oligoflexus sp. TaxID=1971216 RepID=UPI002D340399|nr:hypothetical protein [Oligoflexus sp.]HYX31540.1 hypothetical protein [Oligoflexus sp.]
MKVTMKQSLVALALLTVSCQQNNTDSSIKVTSVKHTEVKRQSIGNCWLYAQATWLESLLKDTTGEEVNISETYWTYWDLYNKLLEKEPVPEKELNTGGTWTMSSNIIKKYGWVTEAEFIDSEATEQMSEAQKCAQTYIMEQGKEGGTLFDVNLRTPEYVRAELDKAFSCAGKYTVNMDAALEKSRKAADTMLVNIKTGDQHSLTDMLNSWKQVSGPGSYGSYEGKKLITEDEIRRYRGLEQRIKKALNDHYPVVMSFYVTFNAPDNKGVFNLNTLAEKGDLGSGGGHMVVLHDYTVDKVPTDDGFISLSEGDLDPELKEKAVLGELNYLVAKNSWGGNRTDRPWLRDGYSRFTWDYLQNRYWDEENEIYRSFFRAVVLPAGY